VSSGDSGLYKGSLPLQTTVSRGNLVVDHYFRNVLVPVSSTLTGISTYAVVTDKDRSNCQEVSLDQPEPGSTANLKRTLVSSPANSPPILGKVGPKRQHRTCTHSQETGRFNSAIASRHSYM